MLALYRSGRQADALESYREARRSLVEELGLEPGRALQELERAILAHDPALEPPARRSTPRPAAAARRARRGGWLIAAAGAVLLAAIDRGRGQAVGLGRRFGAGAGELGGGDRPAQQQRRGRRFRWESTRRDRVWFGVAVGREPRRSDRLARSTRASLRTLRTIPLGGPADGSGRERGRDLGGAVQSASEHRVGERIDPAVRPSSAPRSGSRTSCPAARERSRPQGDTVWVAPSSGLLTRLDPATGRRRAAHRSELRADRRSRRRRRRLGDRHRGRQRHPRRPDRAADADRGRQRTDAGSRSARVACGSRTRSTTRSCGSTRPRHR